MNFKPEALPPENPLSSRLHQIAFDQIKNWEKDDHLAAFNCFCKSAIRIKKQPYTTKSLGVSSNDLAYIARKALESSVATGGDAKGFFETNFTPHIFSGDRTDGAQKSGMLTGYFEPEHPASPVATEKFKYPLFARPDDLIDIDDNNRPDTMDPGYVFGRQTGTGFTQYFDRQQIGSGALSGRGLELFWLQDPVDVFFIHIQGSARLTLPDGTRESVSYAAKSGHPYTPIGKILADRGKLELSEITMDTIRQWLDDNRDKRDELLNENRSFIFFQKTRRANSETGPIAAAGIALTPGRSLAIDHRLHTFGTPIWVETQDNFVGKNHPMERLLISQDTGSAIIGPQRGDLFTGSGEAAGKIAGQLKHPATMTILVPNNAVG